MRLFPPRVTGRGSQRRRQVSCHVIAQPNRTPWAMGVIGGAMVPPRPPACHPSLRAQGPIKLWDIRTGPVSERPISGSARSFFNSADGLNVRILVEREGFD